MKRRRQKVFFCFFIFCIFLINIFDAKALGLGVVPDKIEISARQNSCIDYEVSINNPGNKAIYYEMENNEFFSFNPNNGKLNKSDIRKIIARFCSNYLPVGIYDTIIIVKAYEKNSEKNSQKNKVSTGVGIKARIEVLENNNNTNLVIDNLNNLGAGQEEKEEAELGDTLTNANNTLMDKLAEQDKMNLIAIVVLLFLLAVSVIVVLFKR